MTAKLIKSILAMVMMVTLTFSMASAAERFKTDEMAESGQIVSYPMTAEEMENVSALVAKLSKAAKRGNMTPEMQATTAEILILVSQMITEMTCPPDKDTDRKHQHQIQTEEKGCNIFEQLCEQMVEH